MRRCHRQDQARGQQRCQQIVGGLDTTRVEPRPQGSAPWACSTCGDRDLAGGGAKLGCDAGGWTVRSHPGEGATAHYAAFDVSDKETAIHVLDAHGKAVWKGKRPS